MKNRNINIDIIKGIGIILMVGGHCGMPFTHFIYLFHMAIFFMASGYCFNASNSETMQDVLSFVKRKFKGLWFPYVLWMAVFTLLHNVFVKIGIYSPEPWSIGEIGKNIVKSLFLHGHTQLGSALWFISTLMQIAVLYCCIDYVIKKVTVSKKANFLLQGAVSIVFLAVGYRCALTDSIWGGGKQSVILLLLVLFGGGSERTSKDRTHRKISLLENGSCISDFGSLQSNRKYCIG